MKQDYDALDKMPGDAKAIQEKEWEASKVDEWSKKKLPRQDMLKDADKIYEQESKEEE